MSDDAGSVIDADESDDDEVMEVNIAPIGARVKLSQCAAALQGGVGTVRSLSPGCSHMLLALDDDEKEVWVHADDPWEQLDAEAMDTATGEEEEDILEASPIIENWRWTSDGALCGYVYGKEGYRDGELMTTSVVPPEGRFDTHVVSRASRARARHARTPAPRARHTHPARRRAPATPRR